jgi:preprotein translocase SecE subunit
MAKKEEKGKRADKVSSKLHVHKKTLREQQAEGPEVEKVSLWRMFWRGFFLPIRYIWRGLAWLAHRPPLKQIGHGLRWFFMLKPVRFIGRIVGLGYLRDSLKELRTVTWPTFKESTRLTGAVIIFSIIFGLFVAIVDFGLDKVFKQILLK